MAAELDGGGVDRRGGGTAMEEWRHGVTGGEEG